jgi:hypothetical protein
VVSVDYTLSSDFSEITFTVTVAVEGWISLGVSPDGMMGSGSVGLLVAIYV